jgi:NADH-quinone oxidoreductase subunit J
VENFLFYLMALCTLAGALGVVLARNPVASVLALLGSFFSLATIYLLAGFQLLAAAQILVYAGAIMVLFLFVIMLLNLGHAGALPDLDREMFSRRRSALAIAVAAALFIAAAVAITAVERPPEVAEMPVHGLDATESLARSLFGPYALPFEATSLLLLATAVAVVVLAKRNRTADGATGIAEKGGSA